MRKPVTLVSVLMVLGSPAVAQKAEIQKSNERWIDLFNKGDFAGIGMLYTRDAVALPADAPMVRGRAAISDMWKGLASKVGEPSLQTLEVKRLGPNVARELGTFKLKSKGSNPQEVSGKYVVIWQKENGTWRLSTDIWNSGH